MTGERRSSLGDRLNAAIRSVTDRVRRWRGQPPPEEAGVREPRRPRPSPPAAGIALHEPRIALYRRWMKRRDGGPGIGHG
jgi:hypothetical protein